jgi:uncharacterized protein YlaI
MLERCNRCGYIGHVANKRLHTQPILAFFNQGGRHRYNIDVWLCDVCASEIRNHADSSLNSREATDQAESEKGDQDI